MDRVITYLGIICFIAYAIYQVFWNVSSLFHRTIKKDDNQSNKDLSKGHNWIASTLIIIATLCCLILYFFN
jgi:hypothetical protein